MIDLVAVCPRCRRLTGRGTCDADGSEALELADPAQRERMVELIWGNAAQRDALLLARDRKIMPRRGASAFAGAIATGAAYLGTGDMMVSVLVGTVSAVFGAVAGSSRPTLLIPSPALPMPAFARVGTGKITQCDELISPGSSAPCAGWAVELRYAGSWGSRTTFRAGATLGMDIVMDGGDRVRIPAGPLWVDGPLAQLDGEDQAIDELLADLDPDGKDRDWALFPFNIIMEQLVNQGDRVDVLGVVEPRPVAGDARLYRDTPEIELVHRGLPVLRRA